MDKTKPKATYITHDGYVRPCCFLHRHNQVEADERWLNDKKQVKIFLLDVLIYVKVQKEVTIQFLDHMIIVKKSILKD
jgi:hypothetical protein